jgi:formylglycine-generating enzyme required for sulfatase activity
VQVSPFYLDRYEITIGRFWPFLTALDNGWLANFLSQGAGADPNRPTYPEPDGGAESTGWWSQFATDCYFNADGKQHQSCVLTRGKDINTDILTRCSAQNSSTQAVATGDWTGVPGENMNKPMPCITWYEAMMFCIYDEGRIPTEAEWNFAAAGGSQQRAFPWSIPPGDKGITAALASYDLSEASDVGTYPSGMGLFGQYDMAGNVWEWTLDSPTDRDGSLLYGGDPDNPVDLSGFPLGSGRVLRGGSFETTEATPSPASLRTSARTMLPATGRYRDVGARCARNTIAPP